MLSKAILEILLDTVESQSFIHVKGHELNALIPYYYECHYNVVIKLLICCYSEDIMMVMNIPIVVTLLGIVMDTREEHEKKP